MSCCTESLLIASFPKEGGRRFLRAPGASQQTPSALLSTRKGSCSIPVDASMWGREGLLRGTERHPSADGFQQDDTLLSRCDFQGGCSQGVSADERHTSQETRGHAWPHCGSVCSYYLLDWGDRDHLAGDHPGSRSRAEERPEPASALFCPRRG